MTEPATTASDLRPYPAYKPSGVEWLGEVPAHWEEGRLGNSVQGCISGIWGNDPNGRDDLICVRVADFDRPRLRIRLTRPTLRAVTHSEQRQRLLTRGDLLLEKSGGGELQPVGAVMLYDHDDVAVCSNFVARMPVSARCNAKFLVYLHAYLYAIRLTVRSIKQTTGIQNLSSNSYLSETVAYPPLPEQAAIARYLDYADQRIRRCIQAKEKLVELLEDRRQTLVNEVVTGRVDVRTGQPYSAYKPSKVGRMPTHWEVRRLKTIASIRYGLGQPPPESKHGLPLIRATNIDNGRIVRKDLIHVDPANVPISRNPFLDRKEIIVVRSGAYTADSAIVEEPYVGAIAGYDMVVRVTGAEPKFIAGALLSKYVRHDQLIVVSTRSAQPHLNAEELGSAVLLLPPRPEQSAIVSYVDDADRRIRRYVESVQRQIHLLNEYRTRLIADVVTGKLDVREAASGLANNREELEVITGLDDSAVTSGEKCPQRQRRHPSE